MSSTPPSRKATKRPAHHPMSKNPLFIEWLTEWKEQAAARELKSEYTYAKALQSLKKYPLTFYSGKECKILEGFGDKICQMLDNQLAKYISELGTSQSVVDVINSHRDEVQRSLAAICSDTDQQPIKRRRSKKSTSVSSSDDCAATATPEAQQKTRKYIPVIRSGAYALLITLYRRQEGSTEVVQMTKKELMKEAQPLSATSFTRPDPGSRYTAWSSMGTLLKKQLITRESCPAKYLLTPAGRDLARRLVQADLGHTAGPSCSATTSPVLQPIFFNGLSDKPADPWSNKINSNIGNDDYAAQSTVMDQGTDDVKISDLCPGKYATSSSDGRPSYLVGLEEEFNESWMGYDNTVRCGDEYKNNNDSDDDGAVASCSASASLPNVLTEESRDFTRLLNSGLSFVYITDEGEEVLIKDKAAISFDDKISVGFLVKTKYEDLLLSGKQYKLDTTRQYCGEYVYAYLSDGDAPDRVSSFLPTRFNSNEHFTSTINASDHATSLLIHDKKAKFLNVNNGNDKLHCASSCSENRKTDLADSRETVSSFSGAVTKVRIKSSQTSHKSDANSFPFLPPPLPDPSRSKLQHSTSVSLLSLPPPSISRSSLPNAATTSSLSSSSLPLPSTTFLPPPIAPCLTSLPLSKPGKAVFENCSISSATSSGAEIEQDSDDLGVPEFVLVPGTFDVILCVDNHEIFSGSTYNREQLIRELDANAVSYELRNLQIGDYLWVARYKHTGSKVGVVGSSPVQEVVLDYIIERKRIDDLAGSIIDGRFKEQKHRMNNCGLRHPVYLFEDYGSMQHFSIPEDSLHQAIVNTQTKTLMGYKKYLRTQDVNNLPIAKADVIHLMAYNVFNESSVKTKPLTVSETFTKLLMQIHGLTAEKASVIVQHYPTPTLLCDAYRNCTTDKQRHDLLAELKFGATKRLAFFLRVEAYTHKHCPIPIAAVRESPSFYATLLGSLFI